MDEYKKAVYYTNSGEKVERWSGITGGHSVRVLRYNEDDEKLMVYVDNSSKIMPRTEVMDYIKRRISD